VRVRSNGTPRASVVILVQRNAPQALRAIASVERATDGTLPYEIIVLLNGADAASVSTLQREAAASARIFVSEANLGFGGGCNFGAGQSTAEYLVFLNDDVIVDEGWLEALVNCADEDASITAVGSRIRFPDGTLQEAGSIIWQDGSTAPIGRGLDAAGPEWRFRRDVSYCSACSLLVRRADFVAVGGYDEAYFPAYYEDVDLCFALRERGKRVVYEPASEMVHLESQSSTSDFKSYLFKRNHRRLTQKWHDQLTSFEYADPQSPSAIDRAMWRASGRGKNVLVIDDRLPDAGLGSGYGRMNELLQDLATPAYRVRMFATNDRSPDPVGIGRLGIETIFGSLEEHILDPSRSYDVAIISRPHNYEKFASLLREAQPDCKICYDVESLFFRRIEKQVLLETDTARKAALQNASIAGKELESNIVRNVDRLVCISDDERAFCETVDGHAPVDFMLPLSRGIRLSSDSFRQREMMLVFVAGWMAGPVSPNVDALAWFVEDVFPRVLKVLPHATLIVTGGSPPENALVYKSAVVRFAGFVPDLAALYARARVAIAPIRFGAGVKIKTVEAIQYGVPVVSTTVGSEGIALSCELAITIADNSEQFAANVSAMLVDEAAWSRSRLAIEKQVQVWENANATTWADVCASMLR
jgi:GT2 family glycosyltransferase/glycosyltransferase involved in cell wall biosynthesis